MKTHYEFEVPVRAFSGERFAVRRRVRVDVNTGAVLVFDPLHYRFTGDHSLTEAEKARFRELAKVAT